MFRSWDMIQNTDIVFSGMEDSTMAGGNGQEKGSVSEISQEQDTSVTGQQNGSLLPDASRDPEILPTVVSTQNNMSEQTQHQLDSLNEKITKMAKTLEEISTAVKKEEVAEDTSRDRKRLKERLQAAAKAEYSGKDFISKGWLEVVFGIHDENVRLGIEGNRIIHPASPFMVGVLVVSGLFLLYTAAVVPVQLFMWNYDDLCVHFPTLYFDVVVDSFFIVEVILQFFTGFYDDDGLYVDSLTTVGVHNLSSPWRFWFDIVTSIPFSFIDLHFYRDCIRGISHTDESDTKVLRLVKILRFLRIVRVTRFFKFLIKFQDYILIFVGSAVFKIGRLLFFACAVVHFYACIFYRVKVDYSDDAVVEAFMSAKGASAADLAAAYMVCFYFVWTVFTTVGFGDMYATNKQEEIFCVFLFISAATIFAMLVAQINEIIGGLQAASKELDAYIDAYLTITPRLKTDTLLSIRAFERYSFKEQQLLRQSVDVLSRQCLPENLRVAVAQRVENNLYSKVYFLSELEAIQNIRALFSAELLIRSTTKYFSETSLIADSKDVADGLMVVTSGEVRIELPLDSAEADEEREAKGNTALLVLKRGDSFGDTAILGDKRWAGKWGVQADFVAKTHCAIAYTTVKDIEAILHKFEYFPIRCRIDRAKVQRDDSLADIDRNPNFWPVQSQQTAPAAESAPTNVRKLKSKAVFFWTLIARRLWENRIRRRVASPPVKKAPQTKEPTLETSASQTLANRTMSKLNKGYKLSTMQEEQINEAFELFDTDGSTKMSGKELAAAMLALGFQTDGDDAHFLKGLLDSDNSDEIDKEEFKNFMTGELTSQGCEKELQNSFKDLAAFGSGDFVDKAKLTKACRQLRVILDEKEIQMLIKNVDRDDDGKVDQEEFMHIMKNSWWF